MTARISAALVAALLANGAQSATDDLVDMSLEQLSRMQVSTVSRKAQELSDTAAAVTVLTREDIARSGARSIPEALRHVPGLQTAQIGAGQWAVSVRGFNRRFSNKLLIQVDGRTVYTPFFGGVFWDALNLILDDIDRIEVVRGPGASLWGSNAVNGVINIVTRGAGQTLGGLARLSISDRGRSEVQARQGFAIGEAGAARVFARSVGRDGLQGADGGQIDRPQHGWSAGFRADLGSDAGSKWTVQGDAFHLRAAEQLDFSDAAVGFAFSTGFEMRYEGANLLASGVWALGFGEASARAYVDHLAIEAPGFARGSIDTLDVDFHHRVNPLARHDVIWGFGARHFAFDARSTAPVIDFSVESGREHILSAFVHDEIALSPGRWKLILGARAEQNSLAGGTEVQPNLRVLWTPGDRDSVWLQWSRAARTPSVGEQYGIVAVGVAGVPAGLQPPACRLSPIPCAVGVISRTAPGSRLEAEHLTAIELGMRRQLTTGSVAAVAYRHDLENLVEHTLGAVETPSALPFPAIANQFVDRRNGGKAHVLGLELSFDLRLTREFRLAGAYTLQNAVMGASSGLEGVAPDSELENTLPHVMASLRAAFDLASGHDLDLMWRHVGPLGVSRFGSAVPGYQALDINYRWQTGKHLEVSLYVQNLLDQRHPEFAGDFFPAPLAQSPRRAFVSASLRF